LVPGGAAVAAAVVAAEVVADAVAVRAEAEAMHPEAAEEGLRFRRR